jgi:hypothetical protein
MQHREIPLFLSSQSPSPTRSEPSPPPLSPTTLRRLETHPWNCPHFLAESIRIRYMN